jgi:hypothetical protein
MNQTLAGIIAEHIRAVNVLDLEAIVATVLNGRLRQ